MEDLSHIRNLGVVAHIDAGKTTTTERILYYSGMTHKMGEVDDGTTITDFDSEEQERGITIYSAAVTLEWRDHKINLIDTPGHVDFTAEVERSLRVLDGAVIVFDGKEGVEAQSETVWRQADKYQVPRMCFINKMDKTGAEFHHAFATIRARLNSNPIAIQIPIGHENAFRGMIDLVRMKAIVYGAAEDGSKFDMVDIPAELRGEAVKYRQIMEEKVAELDEALYAKFCDNQPFSEAEIMAALRKGTIRLECQPVLCGSSLKYVGVQFLLDAVCDYLPSPLDRPIVEGHDPEDPAKLVRRKCRPDEPLSALVFKIVADSHSDLHFVRVYSGVLKAGSRLTIVGRKKKENVPRLFRMFAKRREQVERASAGDIVAAIGLKEALTGDTLGEAHHNILLEKIDFPETVISMAIEPKSSADRDKLVGALNMLARSDPTFEYRSVVETGQLLISGMGELHLEVIIHRLERDFGVLVKPFKPRVAYRETVTIAAEGEGKLIRQTAGKGQFAVLRLRIEPFKPAPGQDHLLIANEIPAGAIDAHYFHAIEQGVRDASRTGVLGSYPVINVKATLVGGEQSAQDSSEIAFESAAGMAFQKAVEAARPVLLEPIMKVEVVTPEEYFGTINTDLMIRRAEILSTTIRAKSHVIDAEVPLSTMFGYTTTMRSLSQGRASYSMEPCKYAAMPANLAKEVLGAT